jgi:hypothetical protein
MRNISSKLQMSVNRSAAHLLTLLILGGIGSNSWAQVSASGQEQSGDPVAAEFPYQYLPQNLPDPAIAALYPQTWPTYAANQDGTLCLPFPVTRLNRCATG